MTGLVVAGLTVTMLLIIWFKTDAAMEYLELFRCTGWTKISSYRTFLSGCDQASYLSYPKFLAEFYPSFITRLLKCEICCSVWFSLLSCWLYLPLGHFLAVSFVGLSFYRLFDKLVK